MSTKHTPERVRLSEKQRDFIAACDCQYRDGYDSNMRPITRQMPYLFGPMQWEDWGFWSRSAAEQFAERLVERGLIRRDKDFFYWITDAGRAAIAAATGEQT